MLITEPTNHDSARTGERPAQASDRNARARTTEWSSDAPIQGVSFSSIMANIGSEWGASLGLRSVERDLNGQMFEPPPKDARSAQKAQVEQELAAVDARNDRNAPTAVDQAQVNRAEGPAQDASEWPNGPSPWDESKVVRAERTA